MAKELVKNILILLMSMLCCGAFSVLLGKELCWDLANYHYYNPFALLHERKDIDFWPVSFIHQYLNPTLDFFSYYLINHFRPKTTTFLLGAIHGLNIWLLYRIAQSYIGEQSSFFLLILIALLGIYGPTALPGIGSFQNDNLISLFVLGFVLLHTQGLKNILSYSQISAKYFIIAGLLLSLGTGLKLTVSPFIVGAVVANFILPIKLSERFKLNLIFCLSTLAGILLSSGYWMVYLWQTYHNPLFPFFNGIFKSADFYAFNWRDLRFLPHGFFQTLFYPFYFAWDGRTDGEYFQDFRFPLLYILFIAAGIKVYVTRFSYSLDNQNNKRFITIWLYAFFIFSYVPWLFFFSNSRYFVAAEMLSPLLIYLLLKNLAKSRIIFIPLITFSFYAIFYFMHPVKPTRASWYNGNYFNVKLPSYVFNTKEAVVLMAYSAFAMNINPRPQSYLIPFFPKNWHFIGIPFINEIYFFDKKVTPQINKFIHSHTQPFYLLSSQTNMRALYLAAALFGLKANGPCDKITSDRQRLSDQAVLLCPVYFDHKG